MPSEASQQVGLIVEYGKLIPGIALMILTSLLGFIGYLLGRSIKRIDEDLKDSKAEDQVLRDALTASEESIKTEVESINKTMMAVSSDVHILQEQRIADRSDWDDKLSVITDLFKTLTDTISANKRDTDESIDKWSRNMSESIKDTNELINKQAYHASEESKETAGKIGLILGILQARSKD